MRTIIHDLKEKKIKKTSNLKNDVIISSLDCKKYCIGCFSCWLKHPKKCALTDEYSNIVEHLKDSDELIIISENRYGCYSFFVKRILERCIGYVLPYLTIRNKEIHHTSRYDKRIKLRVLFYGKTTEEDKKISNELIKANAINLNAESYEVKHYIKLKELLKCIH